MRSLVIMRGFASGGSNILNRGSLTLRNVLVHKNSRTLRQLQETRITTGVYNTGTLVMNGSSAVNRHWGDPGPGGVVNRGTLTMNDASSIRHNTGMYIAGVVNLGTFTMNDTSAIEENRGAEYDGGVENWGSFTMNDASTVSGNSAGSMSPQGGGVRNRRTGTLTLNDSSSIRGNDGWEFGGGGGIYNEGTVTMNGSSTISGNTASYCAGIWTGEKTATFTMNDSSSIRDNSVYEYDRGGGGGACVEGGTFTMTGASRITANWATPREEDEEGTYGGGGGLYHAKGTLVGVICGPEGGANVYGNTPDDCYIE